MIVLTFAIVLLPFPSSTEDGSIEVGVPIIVTDQLLRFPSSTEDGSIEVRISPADSARVCASFRPQLRTAPLKLQTLGGVQQPDSGFPSSTEDGSIEVAIRAACLGTHQGVSVLN